MRILVLLWLLVSSAVYASPSVIYQYGGNVFMVSPSVLYNDRLYTSALKLSGDKWELIWFDECDGKAKYWLTLQPMPNPSDDVGLFLDTCY